MNEFLNVLEVEKLPLDKMDRFIGVDQDGSIKTASVVVDTELNSESGNAIANNVVTESLESYKRNLDNSIETLLNDVNNDITELSNTVTTDLQKTVNDLTQANDQLRLDVSEDLEEMQNSVDSAVDYLEETVGNIDAVLLEILG